MKNRWFKIFNYIIFFAIGIGLLYLAFREVKLDKLLNELQNANYYWVLLSLVCAVMSHMARAYRWNLLIRPLGYRPLIMNTFYSVMIGYLANFALPRIGEVARCGSLNKKEKIPFDTLIGTVLIERAIDLLTLLGLLAIVLLVKLGAFGTFINETIFQPIFQKFSTVLSFPLYVWLITAGVIAIGIFVYRNKREKLKTNPKAQKLKSLLNGVISGVKTVLHMEKRRYFLLYTLIIWLMYFLMTYVVLFAIPATVNLKPIDGLFILVIASLAMSAPVQGGIGVFHWIVPLGLTLYEIPKVKGLAYATLTHESQAIMILVVGAFSFIMMFFSINRFQKQQNNLL